MRLHPSAIPGYAPMLRIGDLPDSLRELANSCSLNMQQMRIHCREYAASVALKQYADASLNAEWDSYNANKGPSDFSFRPHDTLWPDWSLLGARSAGLALRNYVTALEPMRQNLGRIAMWRDKINFHDLKRVKKDFDTRFPGIDRILSCPLLSGPSTMTVWIEEGTTNASEEAQARGDHRQAA